MNLALIISIVVGSVSVLVGGITIATVFLRTGQVLQRLKDIETRVNRHDYLFDEIGKRFEKSQSDMNQRFETYRYEMSHRFDEVMKRFDELNKRFDAIYQFLTEKT